jgi:hypothetical protein
MMSWMVSIGSITEDEAKTLNTTAGQNEKFSLIFIGLALRESEI